MITIFFATQTGNAEECAHWLLQKLQGRGFPCRLVNLADYRASQLSQEKAALFVVSTFGEGDPPDDAIPFHESLKELRPGALPELKYAVFALGDIDYTLFCNFGYDCDQFLNEAGAFRLLEVEECNLDQARKLPLWVDRIAPLLEPLAQSSQFVAK